MSWVALYLWLAGIPLAWGALNRNTTAAIFWPAVVPFFLIVATLAIAFAPRR